MPIQYTFIDQSKSLTVDDFNLTDYDPYESLANSLYAQNELDNSLKEEFESLKEAWLVGTMFESGYQNLVNHPAYLKIVSMGEQILPLLLTDMFEEKTPWFYALSEITGANPVSEENEGRLNGIISDWKTWAEQNNYA